VSDLDAPTATEQCPRCLDWYESGYRDGAAKTLGMVDAQLIAEWAPIRDHVRRLTTRPTVDELREHRRTAGEHS